MGSWGLEERPSTAVGASETPKEEDWGLLHWGLFILMSLLSTYFFWISIAPMTLVATGSVMVPQGISVVIAER